MAICSVVVTILLVAGNSLLTTAVDTVITETNCSTTANNCTLTDATCSTEGYCIGDATCTATDCSVGPVCGTGEKCYQIYGTTNYRCCTWIGGSSATNPTSSTGSCVDLAASGRPSDCPANAKLCQDALYKDLMRKQCPKTCGYCTASGSSSTSSTTCLDLAASGRPSDCPQLAYLCNNAIYADLMAKQCPKTCNLC